MCPWIPRVPVESSCARVPVDSSCARVPVDSSCARVPVRRPISKNYLEAFVVQTTIQTTTRLK